jgi:SNF2 family DNA or RNA helicase
VPALLQESDLNEDQRVAVSWFEGRKAGLLWSECGCGKTVVMLTALKRLIDGFDAQRILVVGPRLVAERVWHTEVATWAHLKGLKISRVVGTEKQRLKALGEKADVYTLSRDLVAWMESLFIRVVGTDGKGKPQRAQYRRWPWDTVVLDESQSFMSSDSKRFDSMRRLRLLKGFERIYLLTGSFLPNGYRCSWSQVYLVDGGARLGTSEDAFLRRFYRKEVNDGVVTYELIEGAAQTIDRLIADIVLVMRDMQPAVPINVIPVTLSKEEKRLYNTLARNNVLAFGDKQVNAVNAGVLWGKLLQMGNGAVYDGDRQVHHVHDRKLDAIEELLESFRPEAKVLIGYAFQHDLDRTYARLSKAGFDKLGILRKSKSLDDWKAGRITRGLIHPKSAGHGLNDLKDADHVVWFGVTPNFEDFQQLNGRTVGGHRRQGRDIGIHVLLAEGTVDTASYDMLMSKDGTQKSSQVRIIEYVNSLLKEVPREIDRHPGTAAEGLH